jgi:poly(hydroxyalkanoate) granule-associated protein
MATRDRSTDRQRARPRTGGRASTRVPPSRTRSARSSAQTAAKGAQAQLLRGVQQIWLAGMGAVARTQKDGPAAFQDAVFEGLRMLNQSRSAAQRIVRDAFEGAQDALQTRVGGAREQAQETWDNLEALFQSRVQRAMHQLGVPTAEEIRLLTKRVAELNENVKRIDARERVRKSAGAQRRAPGKRARVRKAAKPAPSTE